MPRDLYRTPAEAMPFLRPHLPAGGFTFCEPCAADGTLTRRLEAMGGTCTAQYDLRPLASSVGRLDARNLLSHHLNGATKIITNPPWDTEMLHPMIMRFSRLVRCTWLLFYADWAFTDQGELFMDWRRGQNRVHKIVTVGRLKWIPGSEFTGLENAAWFRIGPPISEPPRFYPRLPSS